MGITGQLQRCVTLRLYELVVLFVVPVILLWLYSLTYCQNEALYRTNLRLKSDRHVAVVPTSMTEKTMKPLEVVKKQKTILYWTMMFSSKNFYFGDGDVFKECPVWACMGTNDRNYQPVDEFDVVMFHGPEMNETDLPAKRSPHQRYVFVDSETQSFHPIPDKPVFRNFFNLTMAYRRDSDIMRPYGFFKKLNSDEIIPPYIPVQWSNVSNAVVAESRRILFNKKSKIAAWFVSHCSTNSKRENVVTKLQKYVTVDVYGLCGTFQCLRSNEVECYKMVEAEYFFYLSFENSMCRDYITEKVYRILEYDVVPVVYGAADYKSFLPPNSYINVLDFPSIEKLANFLVELSKDEERYMEYFKWKNYYKVVNDKNYVICEFCKALHDPHSPNRTIENIYKWWVEGSECESPPRIS